MTTPRAPSTVTFLDSLAQHLATSGLARYSATGAYTPTGLPAILFGRLPDKPDAAILLNVYNDDRTRDDWNPDYYVQFRFRTPGLDPRTTEALADSVFDLLHDVSNVAWGTTKVLLCRRHIRGPIDPDANGRYTRPDSYTITLNPS